MKVCAVKFAAACSMQQESRKLGNWRVDLILVLWRETAGWRRRRERGKSASYRFSRKLAATFVYPNLDNVILWVSAFAEIPLLIYHTINDYHLSNTYIDLIICTRSIDVLPEIQAVQPRRPGALVGTKDVNTHVHGPEFHRLYTTRVLTTIRSSRLLQPQIFN